MANEYSISDAALAAAKARAQLKTAPDRRSYAFVEDYSTRYNKALAAEIEVAMNGSSGSGGSASNSQQVSSSFQGLEAGAERDYIKNLLSQYNNGGTEEFKKQQAYKDSSISAIDSALTDYSKKGAFQDALDATQLSLNKAMETNKPAIQRAMEGAGTSAGSMQALLSQRLASEASLNAGALGAQQAVNYGQISANLLGQRGNLTTGVDQSIDPITKLADLLRVSSSQSSSSSSGNFNPADAINAATNSRNADTNALLANVKRNESNAAIDAAYAPTYTTFAPPQFPNVPVEPTAAPRYTNTGVAASNIINAPSVNNTDLNSGNGYIAINGEKTSIFGNGDDSEYDFYSNL